MCRSHRRVLKGYRAGKLLNEYGRKRRLAYRSGRREFAGLDLPRPYYIGRGMNKTKRKVKTPLSKKLLQTIMSTDLKNKSWNRH